MGEVLNRAIQRLAHQTLWQVAEYLGTLVRFPDEQMKNWQQGNVFTVFNDESKDKGGYRITIERLEPIIPEPPMSLQDMAPFIDRAVAENDRKKELREQGLTTLNEEAHGFGHE